MKEGFVVWFTGLPASGKTTLAKALEAELKRRGVEPVQRLDGDIVRQDLTRDLGFSKEDRDENIRRVAFVAGLLAKNGVAVLCAFVSPYREARRMARMKCPKGLLPGVPFGPHRAGPQRALSEGPGRRD